MQETPNISAVRIIRQLKTSDRCPNIQELFDIRTINYPLLRRVKYYHIPCRQRIDLACFRDNNASFMCICNRNRHANCFTYNFNETYDCQYLNGCENKGKCFRGRVCPMSVVCICPECYYGTKCQFSTKGTGFSLDTILGYEIRRNISIVQQPISIKVSIVIMAIMLLFSILNGILSIMTFQSKKTHEVGCGFYLLVSSSISILTIFLLAYKFVFLLLSQMMLITNRTSLKINCVLIDFILRSLPSINDWLAAAVAIERVLSVIKGVNFNKKKSRSIARWITIFIILLTLGSFIHDCFHRYLADDIQEERTWCLVHYPPIFEIYNSLINILHCLIPFLINIISAILIIIIATRNRSNAQKIKSYKEHLLEQFHHHKHLLISSIGLIFLSIPRLIISFTLGCMKLSRNPWSYLIIYFISFTPALFTFIIFILPSDVYKNEFHGVIQRYRVFFRKNYC